MMKILFALLSLILIFPVFGAPDNAAPSVLIQTIALQKLPMGEKITAYGSIMPAMGATENISFPRAGQVARLYVLAGQVVKKGQPLLEFATDATTAALFRQAETTAVFARSELTRIEDMTARQLATQSQLAAARKALQDAQANLAAQTGIGAGIGTQRISASFDGVVSLLSIQQGDRVLPGMPILQLSRAGKLRATLGIEPEDIGRLRAGMTVEIAAVFGNQPAVASRVLQIHGVINPLTRLVDVDIELQGATSGLLPGMQIRGTIILDNKASWVVPRAAVLRDEQGSFLYQVRAHHAMRVPVTTGVDSGEHAAVSGALDSKLPVVVSGNYELQDGMTVREAKP